MIAKLHGPGGELVGTLPGVPDGTRELIVSPGVFGMLVPGPGWTLATALEVTGQRMLLRAGTVDAFDPAPTEAA